MNLHAIAKVGINAVNPYITVTIRQSTGYATNADGSRTPSYTTASYSGEVQPLQYQDLLKLDALNITGIRRKLYIDGAYNAVLRPADKGGDLVTLPDGTVWLVVFIFEQWPDWCSVCLTAQDNG